MLGTSRLRSNLRRSTHPRQYREQMGAVVVLAGRLVDIAANLTQLGIQFSSDDRQRIGALAARIAGIRADLLSGKVPGQIEVNRENDPPTGVPLLREMEKTVPLIPMVFSGSGLKARMCPRHPATSDDRHFLLRTLIEP